MNNALSFPHLAVIKASAGSGKTYQLTKRIVDFLLSEHIPNNRLRNILAVTFSNNAAKEMKARTLERLKEIYFDDPTLKMRAESLIDLILQNYADFQIKTIDSFMTTIFKSSAIDFGYHPDFEIVMDNTALMKYAFDRFLRTASVRSLDDLEAIIASLNKGADTAYPWSPTTFLFEGIKKIDVKLSALYKKAEVEDYADDQKACEHKMIFCIDAIQKKIEQSGLTPHGNSAYTTALTQIKSNDFQGLSGKAYKNPPVIKPQKDQQIAYDEVIALWEAFKESSWRFTNMLCRTLCAPYIKTLDAVTPMVEQIKKQQGKIFIGDINKALACYLDRQIVPDVYFRMGETIFHFLIDEFQDTAPIQWKNLLPLIENALAQGGSLFVVGDTKQSIYSFRNADYTIMKALEQTNPFPSATHFVSSLETNYRSLPKVLAFNAQVFKINLPKNETYKAAGEKSGLSDYIQHPKDEGNDDGYVEVVILDKSDDAPAEREKIQELISALRARGYRDNDIALLTESNKDAVRATAWLNEKGIPFISYSSLDIRRRKIIGEIMALIHFLNSPPDDFSFGTFILGDVFNKILLANHANTQIANIREFCFQQRRHSRQGRVAPLYKAFQDQFGNLWEQYFEVLFKVSGFLPIYDLVTEIFVRFKLFQEMPKEEAALIQFLNIVSSFETQGFNSLTDFLAASDDEESTGDVHWNMAVPKNANAVHIMTIHKSKGLGFPVVIVLLYDVHEKGLGYIVEEKEETVHLVKINKEEAECDETLEGLYASEKMRTKVNQLNTLYVGLTRPERELYVIGVTKKKDKYPFSLLPIANYPPTEKAIQPVYDSQYASHGDASFRPDPVTLLHRCNPLTFRVEQTEFISVEERLRGEFMHRVLFFVESMDDIAEDRILKIIRRVQQETLSYFPESEIYALIMSVMNHHEIRGYFKIMPGRVIKREQAYADGAGNLFRMDRVVIDTAKVTVMDYKTGFSKAQKYKTQLTNYMEILRHVYPNRVVTGMIVYIDLNDFEIVNAPEIL